VVDLLVSASQDRPADMLYRAVMGIGL